MEGMSESNVKMMRLLVKSCWWVNNSLFTLDQLLIISSVFGHGGSSRESCVDTDAATTLVESRVEEYDTLTYMT